MSGRDGIRGYLYQTLAALIDALNEREDWISFTIEPDESESKVDIVWWLKDQTKRAVQVKSSRNNFGKNNVKVWANQLKGGTTADSYELILIGPHSGSLNNATEIDGVVIPPARQLTPVEMVKQAAHNLDVYLERRNISRIPPQVRELLVGNLVSRLAIYSSTGDPISRQDFDSTLREWILSVYPESILESTKMRCVLLGNTGSFLHQEERFYLTFQAEFVNTGDVTTIIESVVLTVESTDKMVPYQAAFTLAGTPLTILHEGLPRDPNTFCEFALMPSEIRKVHLGFMSILPQYDQFWMKDSAYTFHFYLKYRDREVWIEENQLQIKLTDDMLNSLQQRKFTLFQDLPDPSSIFS